MHCCASDSDDDELSFMAADIILMMLLLPQIVLQMVIQRTILHTQAITLPAQQRPPAANFLRATATSATHLSADYTSTIKVLQ
jgi:hypothetical protein